jgi:hypothetical protein
MNKLKIIGMSNFGKRSTFDFSRKDIVVFFQIFPKFLENMNLEKTNFFFEESHLRKSLENDEYLVDEEYSGVEHTENELFDMEIIFLPETIKVIVRHDKHLREKILEEMKKIVEKLEC